MKLKKWALAAEVLSALAVIASLIVLIIEVGEGNRLARISSYQDITWQFNEIRSSAISDPEMLRLLEQAYVNGDFPEVDSPDGLKLSFNFANNYNTFNVAYFSFQEGIIGEGEWVRLKRTMCAGVDMLPDDYKRALYVRLTDDFIAYLDENC